MCIYFHIFIFSTILFSFSVYFVLFCNSVELNLVSILFIWFFFCSCCEYARILCPPFLNIICYHIVYAWQKNIYIYIVSHIYDVIHTDLCGYTMSCLRYLSWPNQMNVLVQMNEKNKQKLGIYINFDTQHTHSNTTR